MKVILLFQIKCDEIVQFWCSSYHLIDMAENFFFNNSEAVAGTIIKSCNVSHTGSLFAISCQLVHCIVLVH